MQKRTFRVSSRMLFIWCMLAGFIFLFTPQKLTGKFQLAFVRIFRLPLAMQRSMLLSAHADIPITDVVSRAEHNKLQNYLANLTEELNMQQRKYEKLAGLKNRFIWDQVDFVLADVIWSSADNGKNELFIDCGLDAGLIEGQFVINENSVIGVISEVAANTARVRLITDLESKIPVRITGLTAGKIMQGNGDNSATIKMVKHEVRLGDDVYAVKKPAFLPTPMIAAKVTNCQRDPETPLLWTITAEPTTNLQSINTVTVIITNQIKNLKK